MNKLPPPLPPQASLPAPREAGKSIPFSALTIWWPLFGVLASAAIAWSIATITGVSASAAAALATALGIGAVVLPLAQLVRRVAEVPVDTAPTTLSPLDADARSAAFLDRATRELARARRYGCGAALLLVEVDPAGAGRVPVQAVLTQLLQQTAPTLRSTDLLARSSAAQLALLLTPADGTGALDVAERIRERAEQIERLAGPSGGPDRARHTVSIGVALLRPVSAGGADLAFLTDAAALGLHAARLAGGNCVRVAPGGGHSPRLLDPKSRRTQPK